MYYVFELKTEGLALIIILIPLLYPLDLTAERYFLSFQGVEANVVHIDQLIGTEKRDSDDTDVLLLQIWCIH